jgi:cold shock CspA family protein
MTASSPSPETIRFIARILAAQTTSVTDVAETIANIVRTVDTLSAPAASAAAVSLAPASRTRAARIAASRKITAHEIAAIEATTAPKSAIPKTIVLKPRGAAAPRPKRRLMEAPVAEEPEIEAAPEAAPQPRLLRRAEIAHPEQDPAAMLQPTRPAGGPVRGVVKWFDGKTGKGALRLTGVSGDIALERAVLEQSAIKRLYKDQEIEATIQDLGRGRVNLISLSLPGRNPSGAASGLFGSRGNATTTVNRQTRSVQVEVKRDGVRATSAREEAEHVLGGIERLRNTRRMTPSK